MDALRGACLALIVVTATTLVAEQPAALDCAGAKTGAGFDAPHARLEAGRPYGREKTEVKISVP